MNPWETMKYPERITAIIKYPYLGTRENISASSMVPVNNVINTG